MTPLALSFLFLPVVVTAQSEPKREVISPASQSKPAQVQREEFLRNKLEETEQLKKQASEVTVGIGKLAASGKLPQDEEALKLMKSMVDTLQGIQDRLKKIEDEIAAMRGTVADSKKAIPTLTKDVQDLKKIKIGGFAQFQYRDTDQRGGLVDSFRVRRMELSVTENFDARTMFKVSYDLASSNFGSTVNLPADTAASLKDAFLAYKLDDTTTITAGQTRWPLGYELMRPTVDREFPETTIYNSTMFNGERGRGVYLNHGMGSGVSAQVGVWNSLAYLDTEQRSFQGSQGNRLAMSAGLRFSGKNFDAGVSGFAGKRQAVQAGYNGGSQTKIFAPTIDRQFLFLDGQITNLFTRGLFLRAEAMFGKDRVPLSPVSTSSGSTSSGITDPTDARLDQADMAGMHLILGYNFNPKNLLALKYEQFDPNLGAADDFIRGYGASYTYFINPNTRLSLTHEVFVDDSRNSVGSPPLQQRRYGITTLRVQFKF